MTTHVFIVDDITFGLHLRYLFAGTGAKENMIDFNNVSNSSLAPTTEKMLVSMCADANRIRRGDYVIFYLQQNLQRQIYEGKFYGIFKATQDWSFLDNNDGEQYLKEELGKSLTFRALIEPDVVYSEGVTEWEALDEIKDLCSPNQMLWSLIYRKLKGYRGNTMITIYESERLCQLIRNKNGRNSLATANRCLSFDAATQKIVCLDTQRNEYRGRQEDLNVLPRLEQKLIERQAFEVHLQAYIVKCLGKGLNPSLDCAILDGCPLEWLGNEVYCSVGMRKIDVAISLVQRNQRVIVPIELKSRKGDPSDVEQIQRYVEWLRQYYIPNRQSDIQPILLSQPYTHRTQNGYRDLLQAFAVFNRVNCSDCNPLRYIEYTLEDHTLSFERITYTD